MAGLSGGEAAAQRVLTFGISGHRPGAKYSARETVRAQLAALFAAAPKPFALISALAEGADRDAAQAALAAGGALHALTPFDDLSYEADFEDAASVAAFRALLGRAGTARRLNMPHERGDASGPQRDAGYEAAGLAMLDACDALVVVWDGASGPRGGTSATAQTAAGRGLPVLWLDAHGQAAPRIRRADWGWTPIALDAADAVRAWAVGTENRQRG